MKVVAIIQARMGSTRFPGKSMIELAGKPCIQHMIERIKAANLIDEIIIAQPAEGRKGKELSNFCLKKMKIPVFIGSLNDVYGRVLKAAKMSKADIIVDLTADCPMVDPWHINFLVNEVMNNGFDYASNTIIRSWPDGFDVQVCTTDIYEFTEKFITDPIHRFHTSWNIIDKYHIMKPHKEIKTINLKAPKENFFPEWGLTIDEYSDYILIDKIFRHFESKGFGNKFSARMIIDHLINNPDWLEINQEVKRKIPGEG